MKIARGYDSCMIWSMPNEGGFMYKIHTPISSDNTNFSNIEEECEEIDFEELLKSTKKDQYFEKLTKETNKKVKTPEPKSKQESS
jgi:hypothetical protein